MSTVTIQGHDKETYTVSGTDELHGMDHLKALMTENGWEPRHYLLERVITGTRKRPATEICLKGTKSGTFKTIL